MGTCGLKVPCGIAILPALDGRFNDMPPCHGRPTHRHSTLQPTFGRDGRE